MIVHADRVIAAGRSDRAHASADCRAEHATRQRLDAIGYPSLRQVKCAVHDGQLVLAGVVPSFYLKQVAQTVALAVEGVVSVANQLRVEYPSASAGG
jgi:osmotically-inducible protein OsmY